MQRGEKMRRIRGEDVDLGLKEWINEELKSGPGKEYDLGKFFFTVSSGTIGFLLAAEKLTGGATWDCYLILSFAALIGSIILALVNRRTRRYRGRIHLIALSNPALHRTCCQRRAVEL